MTRPVARSQILRAGLSAALRDRRGRASRVRSRCYTPPAVGFHENRHQGVNPMCNRLRILLVHALLIPFVLLCAGLAQTGQSPAVPPYLDPAQPLNLRVDDLISRMTLEEKASQLVNQARATSRVGCSPDRWGGAWLGAGPPARDRPLFCGAPWAGGNFWPPLGPRKG